MGCQGFQTPVAQGAIGIQVNLFQDRVEVINPGGLVAGLRKKDIGRVSRPRNPFLFSILERMDLVENIGSGIKRMRDGMKAYGLSEPKKVSVSTSVHF